MLKFQVKAVDADLPRRLEYSFGSNMENLANIFSIDMETGWITLLSTLDRESRSEYNLTIMVMDSDVDTKMNGESVRLSSTTTVIITVTDYNDNAPQFSKDEFSTAVNEGALPGSYCFLISLNLISISRPLIKGTYLNFLAFWDFCTFIYFIISQNFTPQIVQIEE